MGFVSGLLGTAGGVNGTGISGPSGTNQSQLNTAYNQTQAGIGQQQQFVNQLMAQNGLGNQANVFGQQQALAGQLQGVANGQGPNPALAQLAQSTGANTANQAALMAGQRGSSQNVGLMARQASQQGAANQQQSAGQAATLQAQQSLQAMQQLQGQQQAMQGVAGTQVAQQQAGLGQLQGASQNQQNALLGLQANMNTANAGLASQTMAGQQNMLGNVVGGVGSALGLAEGGKVPASSASQVPALTTYADGGMTQAGTYGTIDYTDPFAKQAAAPAPAPAPVQAAPAPAPIAAAAPPPVAATPAPQATTQQPAQAGPKSNVGKTLNGQQPKLTGMALAGNTIGQGIGKGLSALFGSSKQAPSTPSPADQKSELDLQNQLLQHDAYSGKQTQTPADNSDIPTNDAGQAMAAHGGKVKALVSPGEIYVKPKDVKKVAKGVNPAAVGKKIPGKPKVGGAVNSYANDTVKANLDEGGIVIPRSITQGPNPHWNAMKFVHATIAKNKGKL